MFNTTDNEFYQFVDSAYIDQITFRGHPTNRTPELSFDSCINGNKTFTTTKISDTTTYIYSKTCVTKRDTKHLFNKKERKHNYKLFMPIADTEIVESKLLHNGKLEESRYCDLKILKSSVKFSVYTIKRKGIVWSTRVKCGYYSYEKKTFVFKDVELNKSDTFYCETNSSDNLMLFAEISYLRAPRFLMASCSKNIKF